MTAQQPTPDQIKALARATRLADAIAVANRKAAAEASPQLSKHWRYRGFLARWTWWVLDETTDLELRAGRALTAAGAQKRADAAFLAEHARLKGWGGECGNRKRGIETSRDANRWKPWVN